MEDERIDFSPLDPSRDRVRWERMVRSVAARGRAARRTPILRWARPALAAAAIAAAAAWAPLLVRGGGGGATVAASDPATSLADWARSGETPAPGELIGMFGGDHGR
jgi:hypothetical protein